MHTVAVDWSGAARHEERHLWLADVDVARGRLVALAGCTRQQAATRLLQLADADADLVAGLDFGFSLPAWFLDAAGTATAFELWADEPRLERWLADCASPFWGRPGRRRPPLAPEQHWRRTELATSPRPRSVFQVGGSGAVGTASLRGMPVLHGLRRAGFAIWPFDPPRRPLVLEVWPRLAIGSLVKSRPDRRRAWLREEAAAIPPRLAALAATSADAFDATAAALALAHRFHTDAHADPPPATDPTVRREGWIWSVPFPCGDGAGGPVPEPPSTALPGRSGTMEG